MGGVTVMIGRGGVEEEREGGNVLKEVLVK
jgi:hypothetical protein